MRARHSHTERTLGRSEMESDDDYAWWSGCSVRWCGKFIFSAVALLAALSGTLIIRFNGTFL